MCRRDGTNWRMAKVYAYVLLLLLVSVSVSIGCVIVKMLIAEVWVRLSYRLLSGGWGLVGGWLKIGRSPVIDAGRLARQ